MPPVLEPPEGATEGAPVGPPQGATEGPPVGPPQGATEGAPIGPPPGASEGAPVGQPQTFRQRAGQGMEEFWRGDNLDPLTNSTIGVMKQGMGALGGLLKIVNEKMGKGGDPGDVMDYLKENPTATVQQAGDAVKNGYRGQASQMEHAKQAARAAWLLHNSDTHGFFQGVGGLAENMGELMGLTMTGQPEMAAGPASEMLAEGSKAWKLLESNGLGGRLARAGWAAMKNAGEQFGQTYVHSGGDTAQSTTAAEIAAPLGVAGQGIGEGVQAYRQFMARAASDVMPKETELGGQKFLQLASELVDKEGRPTAPPRAQNIQIGEHPEIMRDRIQAFKQMQTNLAKNGIEQMAKDTNEAVAGSGVGDIMPTVEGGRFRYIPPDGSDVLNEPEARAALDKLKQEWLGTDWKPEDDMKYQQAYNDLQDQLKRNDKFSASQPYQLHDPEAIKNATETWRDAANHAEALGTAKNKQLGLSQEFQNLVKGRDTAQDAFDKAMNNPSADEDLLDQQVQAQKAVRDASAKLTDYVRQKGTQPELPKVFAQRAEEEMKAAEAFREISNTYERHMSLLTTTRDELAGEGLERPQMPRRLGTLSDDIEKIKTKYGDVLNPLIGENGLNHIIGLGDMLQTPRESARAGGMLDLVASDLKRQLHTGWKSGLKYGGLFSLGTLAAHSVGGTAAVSGALIGRGAYLSALREMATNPAKAQAVIEAAKSTKPVSILGPQLSRLFGVGATNAMRNYFPPPTSQRRDDAQ